MSYDANGNEILRKSHTSASTPSAITLNRTTDEELPTDPSFVGQVSVTAVDKEGNFYPYGENRVYYHMAGPAYIKSVDNGSPTDTESPMHCDRHFFMGLNKVFVSPTQDEGDILFTAASILGEKRQLTSKLVSIDVRQISLRGNPPKNRFEIYYTVDGTEPSKNSFIYESAFSVELGTIVKSAVYISGDNEPTLVMEEKFDADEGLYWEGTGTNQCAENVFPASNASFYGDKLSFENYGYSEKYISFNGGEGDVTYTVKAEKSGNHYLAVCYNNGDGTVGESYKIMGISVNNIPVGEYRFYKNGNWDNYWSFRIIKLPLNEGENKISFISSKNSGINLKELMLWHEDDTYTHDKISRIDNGETVNCEYGIDGKALGGMSGFGTAVWRVTVPAGLYKIYAWYSYPTIGLRGISCEINREIAVVWPGHNTTPWGFPGLTWGYRDAEVFIAPGENEVSVIWPVKGPLLGAMMLTPVKTTNTITKRIEASCVKGVGLSLPQKNNTLWDIVTDTNGYFYLVDHDSGKLLSSDGNSLSMVSGEIKGNARWTRAGEAENFDYLVHVTSGKILAVGTDGDLILDDKENYRDSDMKTNRGYWKIHA